MRTPKIYVAYANAHCSTYKLYVVACTVFHYMKILVCFIKPARLLAIVSKFGALMIAFNG
jgi:hypothetical protein